ncbi:MucBP domain-containing protein, partial [Bacillus cereus]|nr:MucBP domain-containing protein [Bacillus cereus]
MHKKKIDFVIVQDASGSFKDSIGSVKNALKQTVGQLDPKYDRVLVTSYQDYKGYKAMNGSILNNNGSGVKTNLHSGLNSGLESAKQGIDKITPFSGTPTASGLQFALQQYEQEKGANDPNRETIFLLVTDGVANVQLDGYIYKTSNRVSDWTGRAYSGEYHQDYKGAMNEVTSIANDIKGKGYKLVTAFWENKEALSAPNNYYDKYESEVGPVSRQALQSMATKPDWFVLSNNIDEFSKSLIQTVSSVAKIEKDKMVLDFNGDLDVKDIRVEGPNGFSTNPVIKNNQLIWDLERQPEGEYTLIYKGKETKPDVNGSDIIGGYLISSDKKFEIPIIKVAPNPNAINCIPGKVQAEKLVDKNLVKVGDSVTYTITAKNVLEKTTAKDVVIEDALPEGLELDASSILLDGKKVEAEVKGNSLKVLVPQIRGVGEAKVTFTAKVTKEEAGTIENMAIVLDPNDPENPHKPKVSIEVEPKKEGNVVTKYVDKEGNELVPGTSTTDQVGKDYKTESKEIPGYKLVEKPKNAEGKYEEGTKEVIYVYEKVEGNVVTKYVDKDGNELVPGTSTTDQVGKDYKTESKEIPGYKLVEKPKNAEGKYEEGTKEVIYVYEKVEGNVVTKYVDKDGNELVPGTSTTDQVGKDYKTESKEIPGYKLVEKPKNAEGKYEEGTQEVIYVYEKVEGNVVTKYVDKDGNELVPGTSTTDQVGKDYKT